MGGCLSYRLKLVRDQVIQVPTEDPPQTKKKKVPTEDTLFQHVTTFSVESLKAATNNFSPGRVFRENEFSKSYKGTLEDGSVVIVKAYDTHLRGVIDFTSMIKLMSGVKHRNVVELIGYCNEDDHKMVVHEFSGDYTLDQLFSGCKVNKVVLDWPRRVSICHGIALALDYLHNGISPRAVIRDVKPSNILIDGSFNPKIMNFERSCLFEDGESHRNGQVTGTLGYLDPEYTKTGRYSEKTDVYSFGITLLEIINGRRNFLPFEQDQEWTGLDKWARQLQESNRIPEIVDATLSKFSEDEVTRLVYVALSCVQLPSTLRATMSEVRLMLSDGYDFRNMVLTRLEV